MNNSEETRCIGSVKENITGVERGIFGMGQWHIDRI